LSILGNRFKTRALMRVRDKYLVAAGFTVLFGAIYEYFSFSVMSFYMIYAFLIPFVGGFLVYYIRDMKCRSTRGIPTQIWGCGILTLTLGALFTGVAEIYGTTSKWSEVYLILGLICLATAIVWRTVWDITSNLKSNLESNIRDWFNDFLKKY